MLQISPPVINLHPFQKRYNLKFANHGEYPLVFKILSTSWKLYQLDRNAGFLRPNTRLELLLTVNTRQPFKQKIQIMYGRLRDANAPFEVAWKQVKNSTSGFTKKVIPIYLKDEQQEQNQQGEEDNEFVRPKSQDAKIKKQANVHEYISIKNSFTSHALETINEQAQLRHLMHRGRRSLNSSHLQKALQHIQNEKKKHLDAEEREELVYEKQQMQRRYKQQLNRSQKLNQQLQIAQKKLQNHSLQILKFQVGHSLGSVCQEYHTSFAGLALLALASFILGYALATL